MTKPIPPSKQPKYRRPLNDKQILLLKLLYKFRFITVGLLQTAQGHKYQATHNDRLKVLYDQNYIGRHYNDTYRIDRRYAEYFILPDGINALKSLNIFKSTVLKNLYKDKTAQPQFIAHSLVSSSSTMPSVDCIRILLASTLKQSLQGVMTCQNYYLMLI